MKRTVEQSKKLHTLITKIGIDEEQKQELVFSFSEGRETSSKNLRFDECNMLIKHLISLSEDDSLKADRMRKKILSICHEMRWKLESGKVDFQRLEAWLLKFGYKHKPFNDYTAKELPTLLTQFENLLKSYYAKK